MNTRIIGFVFALGGVWALTPQARAQRHGFHMMPHMAPTFSRSAFSPGMVRPSFTPRTVRPFVPSFSPRTVRAVTPVTPRIVTPRIVRPAATSVVARPGTTAAPGTTGALPPGVVFSNGSIRTLSGFTPSQAYVNNGLYQPLNRVFNPFFDHFYNPFFYPGYYGYLPYLYSGYGYGGYGGGYGGYGSGYGNLYGTSPYGVGDSSGYVNPYVTPYATNGYGYGVSSGQQPAPAAAPAASTASVLSAAGVPMNGNTLDWPLILRILPGAEPLRKRIEGLYQVGADQAASGTLNSGMSLEMYRAVEKLERLVALDQQERMTFSSAMYAQAERFLRKFKGAARNIQMVVRAGTVNTYVPASSP